VANWGQRLLELLGLELQPSDSQPDLEYMVCFADNGCSEQYEGATDTLCIRVSAFPETYEDAQSKCNTEGGQLLQIYNIDMHVM